MFSLKEMLNIALSKTKDELTVIEYAGKYRVSVKEARAFVKWCRETYYYRSYKSEVNNPFS